MSREPSLEVVDELVPRRPSRGQYALRHAPQPHVRVVLHRLGDRAVGLRQSALGGASGASASGRASAVHQEARAPPAPSGNEPASQPAHTTPPALGEKAPRCSASPQAAHDGQLGREAGRQQQLEAERERLGAARRAPAARRAARARCRAGCRRAGWARWSRAAAAPPRTPARRARARRGARAGAAWAWTRVGLADRAELAAALVHHQPHPAERLEPAAEARLHPPHALRDGAHAAAVGRVEVQHAIGLAVADRAQHDRFCLKRAGHAVNTL